MLFGTTRAGAARLDRRTVLLVPEQQETAVRRQLQKLGYIPRKG
jgi:hypothetical protein